MPMPSCTSRTVCSPCIQGLTETGYQKLRTDLIWLSLSTLHVLGVVHHVLIKRDRSLIRMW